MPGEIDGNHRICDAVNYVARATGQASVLSCVPRRESRLGLAAVVDSTLLDSMIQEPRSCELRYLRPLSSQYP